MGILTKYIIVLSSFTFCAFIGQSQNSPIKNKLAIEYDLSAGVNFGELPDITVMEKIQSTKFMNTITLKYKVASKISVSLIGGYHKSVLNTRYELLDRNFESYDLDKIGITGNEFGVGADFYFRNHRAPLGNSFGAFIKSQSFTATDVSVPGFVGNEFKVSTVLLGVSLNYVTMLSQKSPLYLKYSISGAIPLVSNLTMPEFNNASNSPAMDFITAADNYRDLNLLKIHVGLGYAF